MRKNNCIRNVCDVKKNQWKPLLADASTMAAPEGDGTKLPAAWKTTPSNKAKARVASRA